MGALVGRVEAGRFGAALASVSSEKRGGVFGRCVKDAGLAACITTTTKSERDAVAQVHVEKKREFINATYKTCKQAFCMGVKAVIYSEKQYELS